MRRVVFVDDERRDLSALQAFVRAERIHLDRVVEFVQVNAAAIPEEVADEVERRLGSEKGIVFMDVVLRTPQGGVPSNDDYVGIRVARELWRREPGLPIVALSKYEEDKRTFLAVVSEPAFGANLSKKMLQGLSNERFGEFVEGVAAAVALRLGKSQADAVMKAGAVDWVVICPKVEERNAVERVLEERGVREGDGFRIEGQVVVVVSPGVQGLVPAAVEATLACMEWRPRGLMLTGMCGVVPGKGEVLDVFVPTHAKHYLAGKLEDAVLKPRTQSEIAFSVDAEDVDRIRKCCAAVVASELARDESTARRLPVWRDEAIGSADVLNLDPAMTQQMLDAVAEDVRAVDMEAFAVAAAGRRLKVPTLAVKVGSDALGDRSDTKANACRVAALAGFAVLSEFGKGNLRLKAFA